MQEEGKIRNNFVHIITTTIMSCYNRYILGYPKLILVFVTLLVCGLAIYLPNFKFDASSETLLLKNDQSLEYYRSIKSRYGSDDYIIITYTPKNELFSDTTLNDLQELRDELRKLNHVGSVVTILDVPLIKRVINSLGYPDSKIVTLENKNITIAEAKEKFQFNPMYSKLLVSEDNKTTALLLTLNTETDYFKTIEEQATLREIMLDRILTEQEQQRLDTLTQNIAKSRGDLNRKQAEDVANIRAITKKHNTEAELFIGGVPMIIADSIEYIKKDVLIFGIVIFMLLIITLKVIFGNIYLILLPLLSCCVVGVSVGGLLGYLGLPVSVVSSNFLPLLLIFTLSFTIHIVIRYLELAKNEDVSKHQMIVAQAVKEKFKPCLYAAITTIVAFGSLLVSGVQPLIDFGIIMTIGLAVSFVVVFSFFASSLILFYPKKKLDIEFITASKIMQFISEKIQIYKLITWITFSCLLVASIYGMSFLHVENRFIDYYKKSTEIYQGMETIDARLGGTTPLDIIIDAPKAWFTNLVVADPQLVVEDEYSKDLGGDAGIASTSYWFNIDKLKLIKEIHDYLDSIPETGKVLSIVSSMDFLKDYDEQAVNSNFYLSVLYNTVPDYVKETLFTPYLSEDGNQIRFSIRVFESDKTLNRNQLLTTIHNNLTEKFALDKSQVKTTGMFVLYNNMLESFFASQISTIGIIFVAIFFTFIILFKNLKLGIIAIVPNMFAGAFVLGLMGLLNIPLDLMTIAIASICVGISVDNTIHYFDRFIMEYHNGSGYWKSIKNCHNTVGFAMYYTTITITIGFSVLAFSNFVPTIYFGLLTGCAMLVALLANLFLLPLLIVAFNLKPVNS